MGVAAQGHLPHQDLLEALPEGAVQGPAQRDPRQREGEGRQPPLRRRRQARVAGRHPQARHEGLPQRQAGQEDPDQRRPRRAGQERRRRLPDHQRRPPDHGQEGCGDHDLVVDGGVTDPKDPRYYKEEIPWAVRISDSGEYVHQSFGDYQYLGRSNQSHGCVRATPAGAKWFYQISQRGDVVKIVGTKRKLQWNNGWSYWQLNWTQWKKGSALRPAQS
ncbi:L,D-transpeptidase [Nonomuraea ferruginea]